MPRSSVKGAAKKAVQAEAKLRKTIGIDSRKNSIADSFQNFAAQLGRGTNNISSFDTYGFNPITRVHTLLEWIHRGSWLGGVAIDIVADDMTRAGIEIKGDLEPDAIQAINEEAVRIGLWTGINDTIKWGRLYGGCVGVLLIDGQDVATPFRINTVRNGMFKGILSLDRWMVEPDLTTLVREYGPDLGNPSRYRVNASAPAFVNKWIHYSRCLRIEGIRLPYWQRLVENLWGESVIERLYDRMTAFDAATTGAAQLIHKLHIRNYKIDGFRDIVSAGGDVMTGLSRYVEMMRMFQSLEGMTLLDKEDEYEVHGSTAVSGISELLMQFGQQLAGALQIPLVRLFGMSPAGFNSTGESDLRNYYDGILQQQERCLRTPVTIMYRSIAQSLGIELPDGFTIGFKPLWQLSDKEKGEIAQTVSSAVTQSFESGVISQQTAMQELRQNSEVTGVFSNITDEQIESAELEPPPGPEKVEVAEIKAGEEEGDEDEEDFTRTGTQPRHPNEPRRPAKDRAHDAIAKMAWYHGLPVVIENEQGTERRGKGWSRKMPADYGYIRRVVGADGDMLDCFVGPAPESSVVFVIDHAKRDNSFDEHKVMLGYYARESAIEDYALSYGNDSSRMLACTETNMADFKNWMTVGDLKKPFGLS